MEQWICGIAGLHVLLFISHGVKMSIGIIAFVCAKADIVLQRIHNQRTPHILVYVPLAIKEARGLDLRQDTQERCAAGIFLHSRSKRDPWAGQYKDRSGNALLQIYGYHKM